MSYTQDVTRLLDEWARGDQQALEQLMPLVYGELRQIAASYLRKERRGHTLQPTAVVHEAYIRLVHQKNPKWEDRKHFFGVAARLMRQVLVEHARRKKRHKHGGDHRRLSLEVAESLVQAPSEDLNALDEALTRLTAHDPIKAEVVKLRFFAGLTMPEIAQALELSLATVERHWTYARTWLFAELTEDQE